MTIGQTGYWKDWLPPMMRSWARDYSRAHQAGRLVRDTSGKEVWHWDSWPPTTVLGRVQSEGHGASQGTREQHYAEVYGREGLLVRRAMQGLRYEPRVVLHLLYLAPKMSHAQRYGLMNVGKTTYWELHAEGHVWVASGISRIENGPDSADESVRTGLAPISAAFAIRSA